MIVVDHFIIVGDGETIDLPALAHSAGAISLAHRITPLPDADVPQHQFADAIPKELAEIVDLIFRHHFCISDDHALFGYAEW